MRDQAGIAIAGGPSGAAGSEFDYVMKIYIDYVTNLLYKIPILAQEGTSPETTCGRSQESRPATAARNRTAGGPDPDRQAVRPGAGSRCGSGVPLPETPAWVRGRKSHGGAPRGVPVAPGQVRASQARASRLARATRRKKECACRRSTPPPRGWLNKGRDGGRRRAPRETSVAVRREVRKGCSKK